ncbi:MAG: hypothetical protein KatS3mg102_3008 [Planctomycetota bacterium]|nr:MAG: hypothetical protein KatS3mg102_3008 [Planctomycetota bacterium]
MLCEARHPVQGNAAAMSAHQAEFVRIRSSSPARTRELGRLLGERLEPGDVLALAGELGAGKTELVRGVAAGLGIPPAAVRSPTFTLVNRYQGERGTLVHVDAYRLGGPQALLELGLEQVFVPEAAVCVEWAPRVAAALPAARLEIELEHAGARTRLLRLRPHGARARALLQALAAAGQLQPAEGAAPEGGRACG